MPPKVILLNGEEQAVIYENRLAAAAITPGQLCETDGSGGIQRNATAADAAVGPVWFAIEPVGVKSSGLNIDDDYEADETVRYARVWPGARVFAFLESGGNVAEGADLESAGNGNLQALTTGQAVARALEAVDATGGTARIKVEVL